MVRVAIFLAFLILIGAGHGWGQERSVDQLQKKKQELQNKRVELQNKMLEIQDKRLDSLKGRVLAISLVQMNLIKLTWGTFGPTAVKALVRTARDTYERNVKNSELVRRRPDFYVHMNEGADEYFDRLDGLLRILEDATKKGESK